MLVKIKYRKEALPRLDILLRHYDCIVRYDLGWSEYELAFTFDHLRYDPTIVARDILRDEDITEATFTRIGGNRASLSDQVHRLRSSEQPPG